MNDEKGIDDAKSELRRRAHAAREAIDADVRSSAADALAAHFFSTFEFGAKDVVAGYWPIRDEIDCRGVLTRLMDGGQPVCLPVVRGPAKPLEMRLWAVGAPLFPSGFGALAPAAGAPLVDPDYVLIPLLAFDGRGTRLGYGGGYYDRTLAGLSRRPVVIGCAFSAQELPAIPRGPHDVPIDYVATEAGVRRFAREDVSA